MFKASSCTFLYLPVSVEFAYAKELNLNFNPVQISFFYRGFKSGQLSVNCISFIKISNFCYLYLQQFSKSKEVIYLNFF